MSTLVTVGGSAADVILGAGFNPADTAAAHEREVVTDDVSAETRLEEMRLPSSDALGDVAANCRVRARFLVTASGPRLADVDAGARLDDVEMGTRSDDVAVTSRGPCELEP